MVILYLTLYVYDMISMMLIWCSVGGTERQPILFNKWVGTPRQGILTKGEGSVQLTSLLRCFFEHKKQIFSIIKAAYILLVQGGRLY